VLTNQAEPDRVDIPHEPGQWIAFSELSWSEKQSAARTHSVAAIAIVALMPPAVQDRLDEAQNQAKGQAQPADAEADPGAGYDKGAVLKSSIKSWSYEAPVTPENIDALDDRTAEWAFETAMSMVQRSAAEGEESAPS